MIQKIYNILTNALAWLLIFLMGFSVLNVLWQVFARFILQSPSSYTEELARFLLIWIGLLGAAYASGKKLHLAIDLISGKLNEVRKSYLSILINTLVAFFAIVVMIVGGIRLVWVMLLLKQISPALSLPMGYVYLALPISGFLILFYSIYFIVNELAHIRKKRMQ